MPIKAFDRPPRVRRELSETGRSATGPGHQLWMSMCRAHWQSSPHHEGLTGQASRALWWATRLRSRTRFPRGAISPEIRERDSADRSTSCRTSRCSGRGPINSRSVFNEPGPRGSTDERRTPRGPGSATIEPHLTAHAAERQGVRRATNPDWSSDLNESVRGRRVHSRSMDLSATIAVLTKVQRRTGREEDSQNSVSIAVELTP